MARRTSPSLWPKEVLQSRMQDDFTYQRFHEGVRSEHGVVSCSAYGIAAEVGAEVLRLGGNAMDAGLATAMSQIPFSCGDYVSFAGVFSGLYYDARQRRVQTIEAYWNLPKGETDRRSIPTYAETGNGRTALVPGFMAAVDTWLKQFGTLPLADLLEPAIFFADHGFELGKMGRIIQSRKDVLSRFPETRALFFKPDGTTYGPGDWFRQPRLAETLRKLAEQGIDYMYRGEWAQHFVDTVQAAGGKVTMADMAHYRAEVAEPTRMKVFGAEACIVPGQTYGALQALAGLKALEIGGAAKLGPISDNAHALVRMSQALGYVNEFYGANLYQSMEDRNHRARSLFGEAFDCKSMLSERNIELYWEAVDAGRFTPDCLQSAPAPTHSDCVCVIDREGNMLTLTHSANQVFFGNTGLSVDGIMITDSGVYVPQLGSDIQPGGRISPAVAPSILYCRGSGAAESGADAEAVFATGAIGMGLINKSICHAFNVLALGMDAIQGQHSASIMSPDVYAGITGSEPDASIFVDESQFQPQVLEEARELGLGIKHFSRSSMQADVNGGPFLEGFTVAAQRRDGIHLAVSANWMNGKATSASPSVQQADPGPQQQYLHALVFMSAAHIEATNRIVNQSPAVRSACARLPKDVRIAYHLTDEDGGPDVWWQMTCSRTRGCVLALGQPQEPVDATIVGGYWSNVSLAESLVRDGIPSVDVTSEPFADQPDGKALREAMGLIAEAHGLAWAEGGKLTVVFPERGRDAPLR